MDKLEQVLISLRRILRTTDINAKTLARETGLTTSQLLVLECVDEGGELTLGGVADRVKLSQATVTSIVERLLQARLIVRERSVVDKRKVFVSLTATGAERIRRNSSPLQTRFAERFNQLPSWQQSMLLAAVEQIANLMDADQLDAAPLLDSGLIDLPESQA